MEATWICRTGAVREGAKVDILEIDSGVRIARNASIITTKNIRPRADAVFQAGETVGTVYRLRASTLDGA